MTRGIQAFDGTNGVNPHTKEYIANRVAILVGQFCDVSVLLPRKGLQ